MQRRCGIALLATGILLFALPARGLRAQDPVEREAGRGRAGAEVVEPGHEGALERHRARREALERQRRGEVAPVLPRRGITVGPRAVGAASVGDASPAASVRNAGSARIIDPREARRYPFSGRIPRGPFYLFPFHDHPFRDSYTGPGWGTACMTFIPGRPSPRRPGRIAPYGSPFAFFGFCSPSGFSDGFTSPFLTPHRFQQRFDPYAAPWPAPWPWVGLPFTAPLGPVAAAAHSCFLLAIVDAHGRRYSGAVWLPTLAPDETDAVELAVEAELARGGALLLPGFDGSWIRVRPSLPLESIRSEPCPAATG
ncbi:MAG TPA: hypothetical protein VIL13_06720 [Longimicrobiales bacterium]|jgi:hypothetical protein